MAREFDIQTLFDNHKHTGSDSQRIQLNELEYEKQDAITAPTGGLTIDAEARTAINAIITALENLNLIDEN